VWFLAKEFFLSDVSAECATFSVSVDQFSRLFERVLELERQISSFTNPGRQIEDELQSQERGLESLRLALEKMKISLGGELSQLRNALKQLQATSKPSALPSPSPSPKPSPSPTPKPSGSPTPSAPKSANRVEIPMKEAISLDGIISYLTKKHGGNVQEKGIVTITSRSVSSDPKYPLKNVADLASDSAFWSDDEPGQWVCWDFREMRVHPTDYAIHACYLQSWVVEGSLDGSSWMKIHRPRDNANFRYGSNTASFVASKEAEFRFIRLTQTGKSYDGRDCLHLGAVEFFGTLSE
jgi:hypothetical protein